MLRDGFGIKKSHELRQRREIRTHKKAGKEDSAIAEQAKEAKVLE